MTTLRKAAGLMLLSVKPGFLVMGILGTLGLIIVAFAAIYSRDSQRCNNAQAVLRTLLGRKEPDQ